MKAFYRRSATLILLDSTSWGKQALTLHSFSAAQAPSPRAGRRGRGPPASGPGAAAGGGDRGRAAGAEVRWLEGRLEAAGAPPGDKVSGLLCALNESSLSKSDRPCPTRIRLICSGYALSGSDTVYFTQICPYPGRIVLIQNGLSSSRTNCPDPGQIVLIQDGLSIFRTDCP
jgi:hypothetical protein